MTVLGDRAPQVAIGERTAVVDALRDTRVASHEADVIALLSATEYIDAGAQQRRPSLAAVQHRYDEALRPADPTLEPWDTATSPDALTRLTSALQRATTA